MYDSELEVFLSLSVIFKKTIVGCKVIKSVFGDSQLSGFSAL